MIAVVDSSVVIKWFVGEAGAERALSLRGQPVGAPELLLAECANVFWKKVRLGEYDPADAALAVRAIGRSNITLSPIRALTPRALQIAQALDHPAYDCFYLALAEQQAVPVVTADRRLVQTVISKLDVTNARVVSLDQWQQA